MNGEMYQICAIVAAAKKALKEHRAIQYAPAEFENSVVFLFLPEQKIFGQKKYSSSNVSLWFEHLNRRGLQDIQWICPLAVDDKNLLGFSNAAQCSILCFFKDGRASYWIPNWKFNPEKRCWNTAYSEQPWHHPPAKRPVYDDPTASFRKTLLDIRDLALRIGCDHFAHRFDQARAVLDGAGGCPEDAPQLPAENLRLFQAASLADVFGAMGSWNDSPPFYGA